MTRPARGVWSTAFDGTDAKIATYHRAFLDALTLAGFGTAGGTCTAGGYLDPDAADRGTAAARLRAAGCWRSGRS